MTIELIITGFALMLVCAVFAALFMRAFYLGKYLEALIFKGCASLCFVVFGGLNCFLGETSPSAIIIFIGLCLGIVGDEVIALCQIYPEQNDKFFICGGASFLFGHILYAVALLMLGKANPIIIVLSMLIVSCIGGVYARYRSFLTGSLRNLLILYLGIVIFMTSVASSLLVGGPTLGAALFLLGGLLFTVSDNILFAYRYGEKPRFAQNIALHVSYYVAQFSIAWSISLL